MTENPLRKTQKNEVFEAIQQRGLDPSEFKWVDSGSDLILQTKIIHQPTKYFFSFEYTSGQHCMTCSPILDPVGDSVISGSWENQREYFLEWLDCIKQEIEAPDLWGAISKETKLTEIATASTTGNELFTEKEQIYLASRLHEIERYVIETHHLLGEHSEFVSTEISYLEKAVKRLGRKDWLHITIAVIFNIVVQVGLNSNAARELIRFVTNQLAQLLGTPPLLP